MPNFLKHRRNTLQTGKKRVDFSSLPLDDSDISRVLSSTYSHLRQRDSRIGQNGLTPTRAKEIYTKVRHNIEETLSNMEAPRGGDKGEVDKLAAKLTDMIMRQ